jgi:hypothetical protein
VAVVGGAFLIAIGLAHTGVHVEHDAVQRTAAVHPVNPSPAEIGKREKVLIIRKPFGLEASHLAGGGSLLRCGVTADNPAHRRITPEPVSVIHVLVSGKPTKHRLPQHSDQIMPTVPARASISQTLPGDGHQAERIIELAIGKQPCIRCDTGTVKLQLEAAVEIEPSSVLFRSTRWVRHDRSRFHNIRY